MFSYRIIVLLFSCLIAESILPTRYVIGPNQIRDVTHGWPSKKYIDLRYGPDGSFFAGTNGGLGKIDLLPPNFSESDIENNLYKIIDSNLPEEGNPAVKTYPLDNDGEMLIIVSRITDISDPQGYCQIENEYGEPYCQVGAGISWSLDSGETWQSIEQPLLSSNNKFPCTFNNDVSCFDAPWGEDITYEHGVWSGYYGEERVGNVAFEVAADTEYEYIYAASWYGLLRRFKYTDEDPIWESVPLPRDSDDALYCNEFPPDNYYYGPAFDDNHRPFSVEVSDGYLWVGGSGINKGEIRSEHCIDWTHYTSNNTYEDYEDYNYMLPSNWVVGIHPQKLETVIRIWTINWTQSISAHHLAYTDDDGDTWIREPYFSNDGSVRAIVYNLYSIDTNLDDGVDSEDQLYASTSKGLFKFAGENNWVKEEIANDEIFDEIGILNENNPNFEVQTAIIDGNNNLFIGTTEGLLIRDSFNQFYYPTYLDDYLENLCVYDCFGVCDGTAVLDCTGECNGSALYDCEGVCDGQTECNDNCISGIYDCTGVCDGTAVLDCTGKCDGSALYDCEGICNGQADCNAVLTNRVYPNPYLPAIHTKATFLIQSTNNGKLEIYDFSMSKVFDGDCSLQNQGLSCHWKGLRNNGQRVANGVYFLKVTTGGQTYWEKLGVVNK